ncbi:hypothetical protein SPURM210S_03896 [Streptomyces purpurascens]|nr:hypothetical protein GCM10010303_84300 [Streptomyces purpurascens]
MAGAKDAVGSTVTIADGGCPGIGVVIPHRRKHGQSEFPDWKEQYNKSHKQVRARIEHAFARMKTWKILASAASKATASTAPCSASPGCTTSLSPERQAGRTAAHHGRGDFKIFTRQPLPGVRLPDLDELQTRGVLGVHRASDFTRAFHMAYGIPPKDYRHQAQHITE